MSKKAPCEEESPALLSPLKSVPRSVTRSSFAAYWKVTLALATSRSAFARIHAPATVAGISTHCVSSSAFSETSRHDFHWPSPRSSISSVNLVAVAPSCCSCTARFAKPASRKGSEGTPAWTGSSTQTLPRPMAGPSLSGASRAVNQRLDCDWPGPASAPLAGRLLRNSDLAVSSQPKTRRSCQRVKSPMTLR